jgi:hypothetical protein
MASTFFWLHIDATAQNEEALKIPSWYPEDTLLGVQFEPGGAQAIDGFRQILQEGLLLSVLHHDVVDIGLNIVGL